MEGKEQRIGPVDSALWATLTTQVNNGSVNAMHDSLNPGAGFATISAMLMNMVWGGIGCGLLGYLVYLWITAFVCGLMTGRTPEVFGRKLETREIRLLSALMVLQPVVLLGLTAITLGVPSITANSNPGFHGVSQIFYEFTSAYANNGSGFEGLGDNTKWWNLSCFFVLALGRFPSMLIPLAVAGSLASKRVAPESNGTLRVETPTFGFAMLAVIVLFALLSFLPVLVLGPIGEWLSLAATHS
jgi:K+-transporting ATPase ATPase A chain